MIGLKASSALFLSLSKDGLLEGRCDGTTRKKLKIGTVAAVVSPARRYAATFDAMKMFEEREKGDVVVSVGGGGGARYSNPWCTAWFSFSGFCSTSMRGPRA